MNSTRLTLLVNEAVAIDQQIAEFEKRLKELKAHLVLEARSRVDEATPTDGGGTSIVFEGTGAICRVTTTGRALKSEVRGEGKDIEKVRAATKGFFSRLFEPVLVYRPVDRFREQARELLGKDAAKLIKLCENGGKTTVSFETKEVPS